MAFWRQPLTLTTCGVLVWILSGCTPPSNTVRDEEKDPYVIRAMNREAALDYSGAIESYQRALEANPRSSVAHFRLAFLYIRQDSDPAAAIYHFQEFLRLRPNSEHATVIRQHIVGCKQELAKEFAIGPMAEEVKTQLDGLIQENQQLKEEQQRLAEENRRLRDQLSALQPGLAPPVNRLAASDGRGARLPISPGPGAPVSASRSYTIQSGDTYYSIARRYGIKPSALEAANPGVNPNRLAVGQTLVVPSP